MTEHRCMVCKSTDEGLEPDAVCPKCGNQMIVRSNERTKCPECNSENIVFEEMHPDTDMNEIVFTCKDCGFEE